MAILELDEIGPISGSIAGTYEPLEYYDLADVEGYIAESDAIGCRSVVKIWEETSLTTTTPGMCPWTIRGDAVRRAAVTAGNNLRGTSSRSIKR